MSAVSGTSGTTGTSGSQDTTGSSTTKTAKPPAELTDKNTFLQLLVAQLRYQNPLSPADGVQFISQLAQFSSLEQTVQVGQDMSAIRKLLEANLAPAEGTGEQSGT